LGRLRQGSQTLDRIRVPHDRKPSVGVVISIPSRRSSSTYQLISHPSCISGLGTTDADFLVIPHHDRKFGARQPFSSSLFGKRKRQVPVLVKRPPWQEPLAERYVCLDFPLLTGEQVILDAHKGVKREWWEQKLVRMSELVLRRREMGEYGMLSMEMRFLLNGRVQWNERRIELRGKL
jgi:hypothetical protein